MKFNRERFIDETSGNLDAAFDIIDALTDALVGYADADEVANLEAAGCYSQPHKEIHDAVQKSGMSEYFDS